MIYTKNTSVAGSMCDGAVRLSVIAAFELIEDSVTEMMGELGIDGVTAMRDYGAMWVFSKNTVSFIERPEWREKLTVHSFISGHSPLRLFIDTEICSGGKAAVLSRIEVCALDLETGRIRKPETVGFREEMEEQNKLPAPAFSRFPKSGGEFLEDVTVRSTNLDYCSHTNNIEYVRFILNTYSAEMISSEQIEGIEVHYSSQSHEGDRLTIDRLRQDGSDLFFIRREGKETAAAAVRSSSLKTAAPAESRTQA